MEESNKKITLSRGYPLMEERQLRFKYKGIDQDINDSQE